MKPVFLLLTLFFYAGSITAAPADTTFVEISDTTLPEVYYHKVNFATPTKLVFKNLTHVDGSIYFHQNVNLVAVEFPLLDSCGSYFYFHQNLFLQKLVASNLRSVARYLYVNGNTSLVELNVCNLKKILPDEFTAPPDVYYYILNNTPGVDQQPFCFSAGGAPANLMLSNNTVSENQPVGSFIGNLSVASSAGDNITYYLTEIFTSHDNNKFTIQGNKLFAAATFDYEAKSNYSLRVGAVNQFGEKMTRDFNIEILNDNGEDTALIEISDTVLPSLNYHQVNFAKPTRLVFKNLTHVGEDVYFHQNVNLVSVEFPLLDSCGRYFYFHQNLSLQKISAPNLRTVSGYLLVNGNTSLVKLDVCSLKKILPNEFLTPSEVYYYIKSNTPGVDQEPFCFSTGGAPQNLLVSSNTVSENQAVSSFIGNLSVTSNVGDSITYYLTDMFSGNDNSKFTIQGNKLLTAATFDYETRNAYTLRIGAVNQLGEKITKDFSIQIQDIVNEDTIVIEINDTTLPDVSYHQVNFAKPTKLVFKNLLHVNGGVYFHQNMNFVSAEFPLLDSIGGYFYFHQNNSLQRISAPGLKTISNYLFINGHSSLTELDVCSLSRILPGEYNQEPYYYIRDNKNIDYDSGCFKKTTIIFVPELNIIVKPVPNTYIGHFISDADSVSSIVRYYFVDEQGKEITNPDFIIRGDSVFLAKDYSLYTDSTFSFDINAIRYSRFFGRPAKPAGSTGGVNEKIALKVNMDLSNNLQLKNIWIGNGASNATSVWNNPANWSKGALPDAYTDVEINSGTVIVGTNIICRSIRIKPGATVLVKPGFTFTVTH